MGGQSLGSRHGDLGIVIQPIELPNQSVWNSAVHNSRRAGRGQGHRDPGFLNPGFENCLGGPGHLNNFTVKRETNGGAIGRRSANCTDLCGRRPLYLHKDGFPQYIYI